MRNVILAVTAMLLLVAPVALAQVNNDFGAEPAADRAIHAFGEASFAISSGPNNNPVPPGQTKSPGPPFRTVDKGDISYYHYGDQNFTGEYMVIRNESAWSAFWNMHTSGMSQQPPAPAVDFKSRMVLVAIQGTRPNCCNYHIDFNHLRQQGQTLAAYVHLTEKSGPMQAIMNAFHIVEVKKSAFVQFQEI